MKKYHIVFSVIGLIIGAGLIVNQKFFIGLALSFGSIISALVWYSAMKYK